MVSLTLTPMMCARLLEPDSKAGPGRVSRALERFFDWLVTVYDRALVVALRRRGVTLTSMILTVCLTVALPFGPRVNSQTLPETSAANEVGPPAACACASVGKFSRRQYNDPAGSCSIFFSAIGLAKNSPCATAFEGGSNSNDPIAQSKSVKTIIMALTRDICGFIDLLLAFPVQGHQRAARQRMRSIIDAGDLSLSTVVRTGSNQHTGSGLRRELRSNFPAARQCPRWVVSRHSVPFVPRPVCTKNLIHIDGKLESPKLT